MHLTFVFMPVALFYFCCIYLPVRENNAYIKPVRGAKKVGDPCSKPYAQVKKKYSQSGRMSFMTVMASICDSRLLSMNFFHALRFLVKLLERK